MPPGEVQTAAQTEVTSRDCRLCFQEHRGPLWNITERTQVATENSVTPGVMMHASESSDCLTCLMCTVTGKTAVWKTTVREATGHTSIKRLAGPDFRTEIGRANEAFAIASLRRGRRAMAGEVNACACRSAGSARAAHRVGPHYTRIKAPFAKAIAGVMNYARKKQLHLGQRKGDRCSADKDRCANHGEGRDPLEFLPDLRDPISLCVVAKTECAHRCTLGRLRFGASPPRPCGCLQLLAMIRTTL